MPTIAFTKGQGTGNDFVIVADPDGALALIDDQVAVLCDRRFGIGADGLLRVVRSSAIAEGAATTDAEWFMDYRNADGSPAQTCGNGIRVFAHYLLQSGLADMPASGPLLVGTRAGTRTVSAADGGYEVDLGAYRLDEGDVLVRAKGLPVARPGVAVNTGNDHVVVALSGDAELDGLDLTAQPLLDPAPPSGANVEFVVPAAMRTGAGAEPVGVLRMRVFERGVGETLSCGSGAAAAALAVRHWGGQGAPDRWIIEVPGGSLGVRAAEGRVLVSGPATLVFTGEVALA